MYVFGFNFVKDDMNKIKLTKFKEAIIIWINL